jgi:hypothetical protein
MSLSISVHGLRRNTITASDLRIQVLGSYQTVSTEQWRIALNKHPDYVSERKTLQLHSGLADPEARRVYYQKRLQRGAFASKVGRSLLSDSRQRS